MKRTNSRDLVIEALRKKEQTTIGQLTDLKNRFESGEILEDYYNRLKAVFERSLKIARNLAESRSSEVNGK